MVEQRDLVSTRPRRLHQRWPQENPAADDQQPHDGRIAGALVPVDASSPL
jgi:hypothetical protein